MLPRITGNQGFIRNRLAFYLIVVTQTLSMIGSRLTAVGIGIWLFQTTGTTAPLLLTSFFNELPGMLGGSLAGVVVDRWDRRKVLILSDTGQALGSLVLLISLASGNFQVWHLYLVSLVQGSFAIFQSPTQDAVTTMLVPLDHRERANAIRQMAFPLAGVIAPVLAGVLFVSIGITGIIAVDLATFLVAVSAVFAIHIPRPPVSAESKVYNGHWLREMVSGFQYLAGQRGLFFYVLYMTFGNFLLNGPLELTIPYLISRTGNEQIAGSLLGLMSLGALIGASLIALIGKTRHKIRIQMLGSLLTGVMFLIYGTSSSAWLLGASLLILMIPLPVGNVIETSLLQSKTPPDMQGRIFATMSQFALLGSTVSFLLTGQLVDRWIEPAVGQPGWEAWAPLVGSQPGAGMGLVQVVAGVFMLASTLLVLALPSVRKMETTLPDYAPAEVEE